MFTKPYSDDTARIIDEEVSKLVEAQYQRAYAILLENKDKLTQLAEKLLASEVIFKEDLEAIFGKRAWDREHVQEQLGDAKIPEELRDEVAKDFVHSDEEKSGGHGIVEKSDHEVDAEENETGTGTEMEDGLSDEK